MSNALESRVLRLAEVARDEAIKAGKLSGSFAFRQFIRGQWLVVADFHPQLATFKALFLETAGAA